jgi:hypothetical protein
MTLEGVDRAVEITTALQAPVPEFGQRARRRRSVWAGDRMIDDAVILGNSSAIVCATNHIPRHMFSGEHCTGSCNCHVQSTKAIRKLLGMHDDK